MTPRTKTSPTTKKRSRGRAAAAGARARVGPGNSLDAIFRPRSVAVVGASRRKQSIGRELLRNIVQFEFDRPVYPVNPEAAAVRSMKA